MREAKIVKAHLFKFALEKMRDFCDVVIKYKAALPVCGDEDVDKDVDTAVLFVVARLVSYFVVLGLDIGGRWMIWIISAPFSIDILF